MLHKARCTNLNGSHRYIRITFPEPPRPTKNWREGSSIQEDQALKNSRIYFLADETPKLSLR